MNKDLGRIEVALLVVVVLFIIIGMIAFPKLMESRNKTEIGVIRRMREIQAAERAYFERFNGGAGYASERELIDAGLLLYDRRESAGKYRFDVSSSNRPLRFCVTAVPVEDPKGKSFAVTQDGPVFEAPSNGAPVCSDGKLVAGGLKEAKDK